MKNVNHTATQLNLNSTAKLDAYLKDYPPRIHHAFENEIVSTQSFPEPAIAAQLFRKFLIDMDLKSFKGWNLTTVNFTEINAEASEPNNISNDAESFSIFSYLDFSDADLSATQLSHLDFYGSNFSRANLKFANLSNVNLHAANLIETDFFGADLFNSSLGAVQGRKANFNTAILKQASLLFSDFSEGNFTRANLRNIFSYNTNFTGAYFTQADVSRAIFMWSILRHAELIETDLTQTDMSSGCDLSYANLEGSYMSYANFTNATFNYAKLQEAILVNSDMRYAKFGNSNATAANFSKAKISNANFDTADCRDAKFADTDLTNANLDASNFQRTDFSRANLKGASAKYTNFVDAIFRGANLEDLNLEGANITRMHLLGTQLQGVLLNGVNNYFFVDRFFEWEDLKKANPEKYPVSSPESQKKPGKALAERCLPLPANASPPEDCEISWEDIENNAFRFRETCDVKQLVVSSREFLWSLLEKDEATQSLWLQLVDVLNITGSTQDKNKIHCLSHFESLSSLLAEPMQSLEINAGNLRNDSTVGDYFSIPSADFSNIDLLNKFRSINDTNPVTKLQFSLNTTLPNLNSIAFQNLDEMVHSHSRYDINFNFLSNEIRKILEIMQTISVYKWPSATQVMFVYNPKPGLVFNEQQTSWLREILNMTEYSQLTENYSEIFRPCQISCFNLTLADRDIIRHTVVKLINPTTFAKPIENFTQNLTSILPYKTVLRFKDDMQLMLDDKTNRLGYSENNQSIANIIQTYADVAHRLNITLVFAKNNATSQLVTIGHKKHEAMSNDLVCESHLIANCDEKNFIINAGSSKLNTTQFPLPEVILYAHGQGAQSILDFRNLAEQIKEYFNASLSVVLSTEMNDLILTRRLCISNNQTHREDIPVISVRLHNALGDRWYKNLKIIPNTAPVKIVGRGLKMHLQPFPLQLNVSDNANYFVMTKKIEANTAILIPRSIDHYAFFRHEDDLVITNAFSPFLEIDRLCNVVLQSFYEDSSKAITCSLEFINKKIMLREERAKIFNATETWDNALLKHKDDLHAAVYQDLPNLNYVVGPRYWPWGQPRRICYSRYRRSINLPEQTEATIISNASTTPVGMLETTSNPIKNSVKWLSEEIVSDYSPKQTHNKTSLDEDIWEKAYNFYDKHDQMQVKHPSKIDKKKSKKAMAFQPKQDENHAKQASEKQTQVISPSRKDINYTHRVDKIDSSQKVTKKPKFQQFVTRDKRSNNNRQFFSTSHTNPTLAVPTRMSPLLTDNYKPRIAERSAEAKIAHQYGGSRTKQSSLSHVTAHVDVPSNLFAMNVLLKLANREKFQPTRSLEATAKYQKMERQNEKINAKIYGQPRMQGIEINARGFNLR